MSILLDKCVCGAVRGEHEHGTQGPGLGECKRTGCKKYTYAGGQK